MLFIVAVSAFFVYWDATNNKIGAVPDKEGFLNISAGMWSFGTFLFWIITVPVYVFKRHSLIEIAKDNPQTVSMRGVKLAFLGLICAVSILPLVNTVNLHEPTLDMSTSETRNLSMQKMTEGMSTEEVERLRATQMVIVSEIAFSINDAGGSAAEVESAINETLNGKTNDEILAIGATMKEKLSTRLANAEAEKDNAQRYATGLMSNMRKDGHCMNLIDTMNNIASSASTEQVRILQIDKVFDAADRAGCIVY